MVISGLKEVHITPTTYPDWTDETLLTNILEDGSFEQVTSSVMSSEGQHLTASVRTTFEFSHVDSDKMSELETLSAAGTLIYLVAYGIDGHVQIWKPARIVATQTIEIKPGGLKKQTVKVQIDHLRSDFVQYSPNLLPVAFAYGSGLSSVSYSVSAGSFTSTTKNGSFTSATSPILKFTGATADIGDTLTIRPVATGAWPVPTGLPTLSVTAKSYADSSGGTYNGFDFTFVNYDIGDVPTETLSYQIPSEGLQSYAYSQALADTDSHHFILQWVLVYNDVAGFIELDEVGFYPGSSNTAFRN